ncbi:hypothetical protein HYDPIDRAFT_166106 [Hydnomerulius pinastri MD-312]|nr:hypothetical protein HYDPIDRAFT_166106 [Hydnomerulius pinastri MD-312]
MSEHSKDSARVAAGLKAAIHNPNVSEEAKEHAMSKLREMGHGVERSSDAYGGATTTGQQESRVLGGYKATLSNPNTSEEAKQHAEEVLQAAGIQGRQAGVSNEEHDTRVLAGYKAALHNPRVSDAAKQHAREFLEEHGASL